IDSRLAERAPRAGAPLAGRLHPQGPRQTPHRPTRRSPARRALDRIATDERRRGFLASPRERGGDSPTRSLSEGLPRAAAGPSLTLRVEMDPLHLKPANPKPATASRPSGGPRPD